MNGLPIAAAMTAAVALALSACGGRPANPVPTVQPTDAMMSCPLIQVEYASNKSRANTLAGEKSEAQEQNAAKVVAMGVTGLLMMDLKDSEQVEIRALKGRNAHLARLMSDKNCPDAPPVSQPASASEATASGDGDATAPVPNCKDVGGYEAYLKKTGQVCIL